MEEPQKEKNQKQPRKKNPPAKKPQDKKQRGIKRIFFFVNKSKNAKWTHEGVGFTLNHPVEYLAKNDAVFMRDFETSDVFCKCVRMYNFKSVGRLTWHHSSHQSLRDLGRKGQWHLFPRKPEPATRAGPNLEATTTNATTREDMDFGNDEDETEEERVAFQRLLRWTPETVAALDKHDYEERVEPSRQYSHIVLERRKTAEEAQGVPRKGVMFGRHPRSAAMFNASEKRSAAMLRTATTAVKTLLSCLWSVATFPVAQLWRKTGGEERKNLPFYGQSG